MLPTSPLSQLIFELGLAFLLGSIPTGYLVGRFHGIDVRESGSGNTGASNLGRLLGRSAGVFTLLIDLTKGILAAILCHQMAGWCVFAAVCGHCFSPFISFRGGKGVATALGGFAAIVPVEVAACVLIFLSVKKWSGYISAGSLAGAVALPILIFFFTGDPTHSAGAATATTGLILVRHHGNLRRIMAGTELTALNRQ